jgi:cytochrome d ubiquinol oxidase subunit II
VLVAAAAFCALLQHGAPWVRLKTEGDLVARSKALARRAWWAVAPLTAMVTVASFRIQPHLAESFRERPWGCVFPALALAGFVGSVLYVLGMLASVAFGLFPYVLPSNADPSLSLTIYNTAPAEYGLRIGLAWWIPGMLLAAAYTVFTHRKFAGKVRMDDGGY